MFEEFIGHICDGCQMTFEEFDLNNGLCDECGIEKNED